MNARLSAAVSLIAFALTLLQTSDAAAATYEVVTCKEAERETLPPTDWHYEPSGADIEMLATCATVPNTLRTRYGVTGTPNGMGAGMKFTAPAPLSITSLRYRMLVNAPKSTDPGRPWWWDMGIFVTDLDGRTERAGGCTGHTIACSGYTLAQGVGLQTPRRAISWFLSCTQETSNSCEYGASLSMFDAVFTIDDPESPRITASPSGPIFAGSHEVAGSQVTSFEAEDAGSGVYRAAVEVDGAVTGSISSPTVEYPNCARPFRVTQPCPRSVVNGIIVDTSALVDGPHDAILRVYDATERNLATYGPVRFTTANRRLANFCEPVPFKFRSNTPDRPLSYGQAWNYRTRVPKAAGWEAVLLEGQRKVDVIGSGSVSPDGHVAFALPAGANRLLRLGVRPKDSRGPYRCGQASWLRVRPRLQLATTPDEVSNGRSVRLHGRLLGRGNRGRSIVIQARARGSHRWATVRVVRTNRQGRFKMKYRFLSTFRTVTYVFRAQVRAGRGYPYASGDSPARRVRVFG